MLTRFNCLNRKVVKDFKIPENFTRTNLNIIINSIETILANTTQKYV